MFWMILEVLRAAVMLFFIIGAVYSGSLYSIIGACMVGAMLYGDE